MGTKAKPGKFDCYANLEDDEPYFVLMGRDVNAPKAVRAWAYERARSINRGEKPESDREMVQEALDCADAMEAYAERRERERSKTTPDDKSGRGGA